MSLENFCMSSYSLLYLISVSSHEVKKIVAMCLFPADPPTQLRDVNSLKQCPTYILVNIKACLCVYSLTHNTHLTYKHTHTVTYKNIKAFN